jgi:hypothetical protein
VHTILGKIQNIVTRTIGKVNPVTKRALKLCSLH